MSVTAYIGLGSNLSDPLSQVQQAVEEIAALPHSSLTGQSRWYRSKAIGPGTQPDYINGVVSLETSLLPIHLLDALQSIEQQHGRVRLQRWGARTLDLDLLLYGTQIINTERLQVPHPYLAQRNFVLYPLFDIQPDLQLPDGLTLDQLLAQCPPDDLEPLPAITAMDSAHDEHFRSSI